MFYPFYSWFMLKIRSLFRINGLLLLMLGVFLFLQPATAFRIAVIIFSLEIIISGGVAVFFVMTEKAYSYRGLLFFVSVFQMLFGLVLLLFPAFSEFLVKLLIVLIGITIIIKGIFTLLESFKARELQLTSRWIGFIIGIFALLFGGFLTTNAFFSFLLLNVLLGLTMIIAGIMVLVLGFQAKEQQKSDSLEIGQ